MPTDVKRAALSQIRQVLTPGGRFLLADFGRANTAAMRGFVWMVRLLRLPEAATLADNVAGRLPDFVSAAGFTEQEVAPRHRGIQFLLCRPVART